MRPNETHPTSFEVPRSIVGEGVRAGSLAATGVALGFLVADLAFGMPFVTPELLGRGAASVVGLTDVTRAAAVTGYTALHYVAFSALGVVAAAVVRLAGRHASVLAGALLVFAIVEVAFAGLVAVLHASTATGTVTWIQLVAGNVLGWVLLALALRRRHPELRGGLGAAVHGTGTWAVR
jgi:hypothetical protein